MFRYTQEKYFDISHIYREVTQVTDKIANVGFSLCDFIWCYSVSDMELDAYNRNLNGVSKFRISYY